jgi:hypothetical protein
MRTRLEALALIEALAMVPATARPADPERSWEEVALPSGGGDGVTPQDRSQALPPAEPPAVTEQAQPEQAQPQATPPQEAPPQQAQPAPVRSGTPDGQWVYTQQYGWIWIPYSDEYVAAYDSGPPYEYVYYPAYGWVWVAAPWIYGWGPWPYFGFYGAVNFGWFAGGGWWWGSPWWWRSAPFRGVRPHPGFHGRGFHGRGFDGRGFDGFRGGRGPGFHGGGFRGGSGGGRPVPSAPRGGGGARGGMGGGMGGGRGGGGGGRR